MAVMIKKVGVIGSGQMGNGIAHVAALAGFDVVLNDISADRLKSGMATINGNLSRQVAKKVITEDTAKRLWRGSRSPIPWRVSPTAIW
jgi:3-hydroxybutyryl-CoA dehydrogenase